MAAPSYKTTKRFLSTPIQKTYTFAGATLVVVIIFLVGAILPTFSTISRLQSEISERKYIESTLQKKLNDIDSLRQAYTQREQDLSFVDQLFPANSDYSLLMSNLEKIAQSYGFELQTWGIAEFAAGKKLKLSYSNLTPLEVQFDITGDKQQLVKLLDHLESLPEVPEITKIGYAPSGSSGELRVSIEMIVLRTNDTLTAN